MLVNTTTSAPLAQAGYHIQVGTDSNNIPGSLFWDSGLVTSRTMGDGATSVRPPALTNDADVEGDSLTLYSVLDTVPNATVEIGAGATNLVYTPGPDFSGADDFNYVVTDGHGGYATARVDIVVTVAWRQKSVIAPIDSSAYDIAAGHGIVHVAYQHGGMIHYAWKTPGESTWSTQVVATGSSPSIAVNSNGIVFIAYENGPTLYEICNTNAWSPVAVTDGYRPTLDISPNGTRYLMALGAWAGNGYTDIGLCINTTGHWSGAQVLQDGYYSYGSGTYFFDACIAARMNNSYAYAYGHTSWGGRADWSSKDAIVELADGPDQSINVENSNSSVELSRQSVSESPIGSAAICSMVGWVRLAWTTNGAWTAFTTLGAGGQAT